MVVNNAKRKKFSRVPPDGGYGYWILLSASVNIIATTMFFTCFGMIFNDFFIRMGMSTTAINVLGGIRALSIALSGLLTGPLLKMLSRRKLALIGSTFFISGVFGTVFVNNKAQFLLCQGFLQTFGFGFLYNVSFTAVNDYFVDRRLLSISIMQTLSAVSVMVAPVIVSWSKAEYGYHGTLIIISAIGMQSFVASSLLQPVEWHMKRVPITGQEHRLLLKSQNNALPEIDEDVGSAQSDEDNESTRSSKYNATKWANMMKVLNWPLVKRYALTGACIGAPTAICTDVLFILNIAQALYAMKWNTDQVKWAFTVIAFGDLVSRIVLTLFSRWLKILGNRAIYLIGLLISTAARLAMLWITDYTATLACLTVVGVSRCIITVLLPLVVSDYVTAEEFPLAIGLSMAFYGCVSICMGPVIGAIRDKMGDYNVMFAILVAIFAIVTVGWTLEMICDWRRKRHATQTATPRQENIQPASGPGRSYRRGSIAF